MESDEKMFSSDDKIAFEGLAAPSKAFGLGLAKL
jgi:hypothetical protein